LVDIEFIAQLGVLCSARLYPRVLNVTSTLLQLKELRSIGWLSDDEARVLRDTARLLRQQRMMTTLIHEEVHTEAPTTGSEAIFKRKVGDSSCTLP
jgi:glutamine synthetase adenylyltransferase